MNSSRKVRVPLRLSQLSRLEHYSSFGPGTERASARKQASTHRRANRILKASARRCCPFPRIQVTFTLLGTHDPPSTLLARPRGLRPPRLPLGPEPAIRVGPRRQAVGPHAQHEAPQTQQPPRLAPRATDPSRQGPRARGVYSRVARLTSLKYLPVRPFDVWLFIPRVSLESAPASGDSSSDSEWRSQLLAQYATLNEKRSPPRSWLRKWKQGGYIRRLFGRISPPSTASLGAERWMASLVDSPASHSARQASSEESRTSAGSGTTSSGSSTTPTSSGASSRTSPALESRDFDVSSETWPPAGSMRNGTCSQRSKSGRPTYAKGSLSWPTATVRDASPSGGGLRTCTIERATRGVNLNLLAEKLWPTPTASPWRSGSASEQTMQRNSRPLSEVVGHLYRSMKTPGAASSSETRRLNPRFVEWLMGFPIGWTDCEHWGTR